MEYSIHPPSPFIQTSWQKLLPRWDVPVLSLLILLQRSPIALRFHTPEASLVKCRLRTQAIRLMLPLVQVLRQEHYLAEMFDPKTGIPYGSDQQGIPLNDVAVIQAVLGYDAEQYGQCRCILHPTWGDRVYPSILVSASSPMTVKPLAEERFQDYFMYRS